MTLELIFWILLFIIFYTYIGYGVLLFITLQLKKIFKKKNKNELNKFEPEVTLLIPAYNEAGFIEQKIQNSLEFDYPKNKIKHIWVTDGSNDESLQILKKYDHITILHEDKRNGKIGAINRAMKFIKTPFVIFSDANTLLSNKTIKEILKHFSDSKVGCVAGEKTINQAHKDLIHSGEGFYWELESLLKKWESKIYSAIAAAGEIFAIRTELFEDTEPNIILDDLVISLRIAKKGYLIKYSSRATAIENASINIKEELKRKIRIASGGFQALKKLGNILNPFKYGILAFFFFSHKVVRWTLAPLSLLAIIPLNLLLVIKTSIPEINHFSIILSLQVLFYLFSLVGMLLKNHKISIRIFAFPYYFCVMNYSIYAGFFRFLKKKQSVNWERSKRF